MKRFVSLTCCLSLLVLAGPVLAALTIDEYHHAIQYPVCRVNNAGSGTIIYSARNAEDTWSTYVLTNHHVVANKIKVSEIWDPDQKEEVKVERRSKVSVEIFQYKDLSTPIGTLKVDSNIVAYSSFKHGADLALLKLELETPIGDVATLIPQDRDVKIFEDLIAVGCSLGWPPIPTKGMLTRKDVDINGYPYHMSSAQIIYGNSGGAIFLQETGAMVGVPARVPALGWGGSDPVPHMGLFIPMATVYAWFEDIGYQFLYDPAYTEADAIAAKKAMAREHQKNVAAQTGPEESKDDEE